MTVSPQNEDQPDLQVRIGPLVLKNPVIAASGTFGYGLELKDFCPPDRLGAVIVKGLSRTPWPGNSGHRIVEAGGGLINSIGLENMGTEAFVRKALPKLKAAGATVGANIIGHSVEEYLKAAEYLAAADIDFLELNVSCPNLSSPGGLSFGSDPDLAARLTEQAVKYAGPVPVIVKLPPMVTDIALLAKRVEMAGAAGISLINTIPAMSVDLKTRRPILGHVTGGLSGPPIKPVALRLVMICARSVKIPVIGIGGIFTAQDALEFMLVGAAAVQMGTAVLTDPTSPLRVIKGLSAWLKAENMTSLGQLIGKLQTGPPPLAPKDNLG
ncbi:MAG: dihydroorotate dehydrogenase [Deltaproteobacteria bacterium]|nr:dihydroorotate dehydrogenase [Deltaproteobacteria bacterium]